MNWKNWRINLVLILIFLFAAAIFGRLFFLNVLNHDFYKALAEGQQKILTPVVGERGEIFFGNGEPVAINKAGKYIFACPKEIKKKKETAQALSEILNQDQEQILEKLEKINLFEAIKHRLSETEQQTLKEKGFEGIYLEDEIYRYYPQESLTSHITGFVGGNQEGQYGAEGFYDQVLRGKEILSEKQKGPSGFLWFPSLKEEGRGKDLFLTIDAGIQFRAEELLYANQEKLSFESGQILVMDPISGEIIAMAAVPNFDPNHYSEIEDPEIFQNPLIQKIFEPGSVFKPVTMAGAIDKGVITPQTTYEDKGIVQIGGWPIYNYNQEVWGQRSMTEVLEKSINTGAVFAERQLGHESFLEYIEKFGFFKKTGIDLQGEVASENLELKKAYEVNFATASFGQGVEVTPIQLARAFSVIANNGKLTQPHIVSSIMENGSELEPESGSQETQVISQKTSSQLTAMLVSVVEEGFSKAAQIDGYFIAGKTGTAQVSWPALGIQKRGYSPKTIQTFIGFFPAFDPQFLILVKLDNPQAKTAEYSALPIFRELAQYIITYKEIPPDHE